MVDKKYIQPLEFEAKFVKHVIESCIENQRVAALLRRANNPATEYQSWEFLAGYGINIEVESERLAFSSIAAAIANANIQTNGSLGLGRAIAICYPGGNQSDQAKTRLRQLIACDNILEILLLLHPLLILIRCRISQRLDYVHLLWQLRCFSSSGQQVKTQWAQEFYNYKTLTGEDT